MLFIFPLNEFLLLPRCMQCRRGLAMRKLSFTCSAVNENGAENNFSFWARNRNETENQPLFSAENETLG